MEPGITPESSFIFHPIGIIHSPYKDTKGMPVQTAGARGVKGSIAIFEKYAGGLKDLEGFSRIILIYALHKSEGSPLEVIPFLDTVKRGVFATRAPKRPNVIGISVVHLVEVEGSTIGIEDVDVLDGTPLLDIKPYIPELDSYPDASPGWTATALKDFRNTRADGRFS
jgi:tRNA-Thr(GGU) m(6)t(6)A37 methyltransferase TsaA